MSKSILEQIENEKDQDKQKELSSRLHGIRTNENVGASLNAIVFSTPTLSTAFPRHDFVKLEYGQEILFKIVITTKDHIIELSGQNLVRLFDLLTLNQIFEICEVESEKIVNDVITAVTKIVIAEINPDNDEDYDYVDNGKEEDIEAYKEDNMQPLVDESYE